MSHRKFARVALRNAGRVLATSLALAAGMAMAQPVPLSFQASPDVYKVLAEGDQFRVIEVSWKPGQRDQTHGHPAAGSYFLTDCKLSFFAPDGARRDTNPRAGHAAAQKPIASHEVQNVGDTECRLIMFEMK